MSSQGSIAEKMFTQLMELAMMPTVEFDRQLLLTICEEVRPGRLANVKAKRNAAGKTTNWKMTPSGLILDWAYGLDYCIDADGQGQLFGFDVTLDPSKVGSKLEKLQSFKPLYDAIGISKVGVVLLVAPPDWGVGVISLLKGEAKDNLIDKLLDQVVYAMDESSAYARQYVVAI